MTTKDEEDAVLRAHWEDHYAKGPFGICTLCGNTGWVDTTGRARSPNGLHECGRRQPCFCPNGRAVRAKGGA